MPIDAFGNYIEEMTGADDGTGASPNDTGDTGAEGAGSFGIPSYMVAADNHSIANNNQTFLEGAAETISNIPKFIGVSIISGANQFYNIAPTIGNFMGGNFELSKTADVVESIDSDLGTYYQEHQESADVAGFILSSIVPGLGGIKVLNAGQKVLEASVATGKLGGNMASSLKLLRTNRKKYLDLAVAEATNSNSLSLLTSKNTLLAMANGYGQSVLEMAAFETAVAVTLSASPVLEEQDLGDITSNILWGGLAFGTIGGIIDITKSASAVKKAIKFADPQAAPWTHRKALHETAPPSAKILNDLQQLHELREIPLVFEPERRAFLENARVSKIRDLNTSIRTEMGKLANGDETVAAQLHAMYKGEAFESNVGNYLGATRVSRVLEVTPEEKIVLRGQKAAEGKGGKISDVEAAAEVNFKPAYVTTWGEGIGNTVPLTRPQHVALSDLLKKNEEIIVKGTKVSAGKQGWDFSLKGIYTEPVRATGPGAKGFISQAGKGTGWDVTTAGMHEAQARHIMAIELPAFNPSANPAKFRAVTIGENDVPLLDKLYREFDPRHGVQLADGTRRTFSDSAEFLSFLDKQKVAIANKMVAAKGSKAKRLRSQEDIASMLNVRNSYLSGVVDPNQARDLFALQSYADDYTKMLVAKELPLNEVPIYKQPRTLKLSYDTSVVKDIDGNILEGMAVITEQACLESQRLQNVTAAYFGEHEAKFVPIPLSRIMTEANRLGAGGKFFTAASSNYGTLAADMEWLGNVFSQVNRQKHEAFRAAVEPAQIKLANNPKAVIEWSTLNARLRGMEDTYVINADRTAFEPAVIARYNEKLAAGETGVKAPRLKDPKTPLEIPIDNIEVLEMAEAHIATNGMRTNHKVALRTGQGTEDATNAAVFYPIPVNPKDFPHFAIVVDRTITGTGHHKTIYASSSEELAEMSGKLAGEPGLEILYKQDALNYYNSIGQFDSARTLGENYLNSALKRKGVSMPYYIPTDAAKVTQDYLNWGLQQETALTREMITAKYERQFEELRRRGEVFTKLETSQFNKLSMASHAENVVKNPYMDYIKTALGIKNYADYPFWTAANRGLDGKVSEMYGKLTKIRESAKTPEELAELNTTLRQYGYTGAAYDMEMELLANHSAPRGVLQNFIQKANGILATVVLRLDHLNAATNYISANILYGAEMSSVIRAIERGSPEAVGELAALRNIKVPGVGNSIPSPTKLLANAYKAFGKDSPELAFYKQNGFVTNISEQYRATLDTLTLSGKETVRELDSKISKVFTSLRTAADKGEQWTGNRLAEEFNRFAAAHTMKQVTDIAVKHGLMDSRSALSYINTFVNRTQGNYLASQRPMLFQGPIGQAIGLFQTYQFNLMQQLLRHVGEGTAKDTATLIGLQGTIFGMNGLPAFNAINTHIIGTASGNEKHRDAYTTVYGAAGKDAGDWLMYGFASNMLLHPDLKTNLYTRGDINPRHLTLVPTDPASVPIVQATGKFFANIADVASKISNGGDFMTSILQGVEHNSISRPLAGLAQTLEGLANPEHASYSTSKRGNVIASNDLLTLTNISRMLGGKPLGEAVAIDTAYRFKTYALADNDKRNKLGEAIKSTMIAGQNPTREQIEAFAESYAKLGGKQQEFSQWMVQLNKTANTSQANELRRNLDSPFSKSMQEIMGGYELRDFSERQ